MADTETQTIVKAEDFFQEIRQILKENAEFLAKSREEEAERRKEEAERRREYDEELAKSREDFDRRIKITDKIVGDLGNRFGEMVEHLVAPSIKEKFRALNMYFDHISQNHQISDNGRSLAEIDLLLENGDIAVAVEVKSKPVRKDVDDHIRRMGVLRKKADAKNDTRKYQGAIAGAVMQDEVRDYAHKAGFYVIEQTGDTVRINIPEGFKAREW